jgi:phosphohistidine phosphatase SixA
MRFAHWSLLAFLFAFCTDAVAQGGAPAWVGALQQGGHVIVFRHGATFPDQADTDPFHPENVSAQRQFNDTGRAQARAAGEAMHKLKITVGKVYTSVTFRAIETGRLLGFGEPRTTIDIAESGMIVSPNENNRRIAALRKLISTPPPAGTNVAVVTHKPNVLDAFGKDWFDIGEGEASIFHPEGDTYKFVARVPIGDWTRVASP